MKEKLSTSSVHGVGFQSKKCQVLIMRVVRLEHSLSKKTLKGFVYRFDEVASKEGPPVDSISKKLIAARFARGFIFI